MTRSPVISADLALLRRDLQQLGAAHQPLLRTELWRPLADIVFDAAVVLACVLAVRSLGGWLVPLALLLIGNRQRALGNVLHDAGHRNLSRHAGLNDFVATLLVAPLLLADLSIYRQLHQQHHSLLGDAQQDPDYVQPRGNGTSWRATYTATLLCRHSWRSSFFGHLIQPLPWPRLVYIVLWWGLAITLLAELAGGATAGLFVLLWFAARASVFHAITVFRELCDHFALNPGGIFSFTRDIHTHSLLRWFIHPRNNGYHLTHHLMPAVPYYRLPEAHRLFQRLPSFRQRGRVCASYFGGGRAVVAVAP